MSGGYIKPQKPGEHQIVVFTFAGGVSPSQAAQWNNDILLLKQEFQQSLTGITLQGDPTPAKILRAASKPPKKKKK
jgi:hypothetical protein